MQPPTILSLFAGLGGFDLAFEQIGFTTAMQCEIDPHALAVLTRHWPNVPKHQDVTTLHGGRIPPVDIITFGSPCQDLSTAGRRAGLDGSRSGLFLEAVRIIREMQEATSGTYPRLALWENVPGALSSNGGGDFTEVLTQLVGGPLRTPARWSAAGVAFGPEGTAEWRILNTRHFGPPQQRRRIFLVYDPRGQRPGEILLEPNRVQGRPQPSTETRPTHTTDTSRSPRSPSLPTTAGALTGQIRYGAADNQARAGWLIPDLAKTVTTREGARQDADTQTLLPVAFKIRGGVEIDSRGQAAGKGYLGSEDAALTLETGSSAQMLAEPIAFDRAAGGTHGMQPGPIAPTLQVSAGIGRAAVALATPSIASSLTTRYGDGSPRGDGSDNLAVVFAENSRGELRLQDGDGQITGTLTTGGGKPGQGTPTIAYPLQGRPGQDGQHGDGYRPADQAAVATATLTYGVRKFTPRETERLQGLPDDWTRHDPQGGEIADSHRYRMTGNAVSVPVVEAIARAIAQVHYPNLVKPE